MPFTTFAMTPEQAIPRYMRLACASLFLALSYLPLSAQGWPAFDDSAPVFEEGNTEVFTIPSSILIEHNGSIEFNPDANSATYIGDFHLSDNNDIKIKARKAILQKSPSSDKLTARLTGNTSITQPAVTLSSGVVQAGIQLFADQARLNTEAKTITLDGNVSIYQGAQLHRGAHAVYNYGNRKLDTQGLASGLGPLLLESDRFRKVTQNGEDVYVGENAGLTTHDVAEPNFWIRSDRTTIYPGEKVTFKNMRLYAGGKKIFWLPYLAQPLDSELGYHFLPGARSSWGAFLLNRYGIMLGGKENELTGKREDAWLLSRWHFDLRSRRGVGLGFDLADTRTKGDAFTGLKTYYIHDLDPLFEQSSEIREPISDNRWKLELKHRIHLAEDSDSQTTLKFNLTALSDRFYLEDFEESTFRTNPNPDNEIALIHRNSKSSSLAGIQARLRVNDFYQTDSRLPHLFYDQAKRPILRTDKINTGILYESQSSWGIFQEDLADFTEDELRDEASRLAPGSGRLSAIEGLLEENGYNRLHTYHELSKPFKVGNFLSLNPHVGAGFTHYSSLDNGADSFNRSYFSLGIDASFKLSRAYPNITNKKWGIDGLLHVIEPYANFSELAADDPNSDFRGIQTLIPSTRPRPLEVGRFTAIDDLSNWSIIRLGVRNNLLTKRNDDTHSWLSTNTYIDGFFNDPEFNRDFSNFYNDIIWQPLPWMSLSLETQFPITSSNADFREFSGNFNFMPNDSLELRIGYRELDNHPTLQDSRSLRVRAYQRISDTWGVGTFHRWELDDNTLEIQEYNIYRNFDSWTASAGIFANDFRNRTEFGVLFNFTLRAFPSLSLPLAGSTQ